MSPAHTSSAPIPFCAPIAPRRWEKLPNSEVDAVLVERVLAGEIAAFEALYERHRGPMLRFCSSLLGDREEARDVTQEVFLEMHRCLRSYRGEGCLWGWLCGIARHRIHDRWSKRALATVPLDACTADRLAAPAARIEQRIDARRALERCSAVMGRELSPTAERMFRMHYVENRSVRAVGRLLHKKPDAVKIALFRARRTLRAHALGVPELLAS